MTAIVERRYRINVSPGYALIHDTRAGRIVTAHRTEHGTVRYSGSVPATVKRVTTHALNRSAY